MNYGDKTPLRELVRPLTERARDSSEYCAQTLLQCKKKCDRIYTLEKKQEFAKKVDDWLTACHLESDGPRGLHWRKKAKMRREVLDQTLAGIS